MSNSIALVGVSSAGGTITGPGSSTVFLDGKPISLNGDKVMPHSPSKTPHSGSPTVIASTSSVFIEGKQVVRTGDSATCGHSVSSGSSTGSAG